MPLPLGLDLGALQAGMKSPSATQRGHQFTGTWHWLQTPLDLGLETFITVCVLVKLIPQPKIRGLKEEGVRAVFGSLSCFPCTFGAPCKGTVPGLGFNPSLPAW